MTDSTSRRTRGKPPQKPKDFPLSIHKGTGYWCRKVKGRVFYFGKVADDPKGTAALEEWLRVKDDLLAGREPRPKDSDLLTLETLCNTFLDHKEGHVKTGEIAPGSWRQYWYICRDLLDVLGKTRAVDDLRPTDFEKVRTAFSDRLGPVQLSKAIQTIRSLFKYGAESQLISHPVLFGPGFKRPAKSVLRRHRAEKGRKLFSKDEIHRLLQRANPVMRAMILLGINGALGNTDIGRLEKRHLNLGTGWLAFPRPKSGVDRRVRLWPETVDAIRAALAVRPAPKDPANSERVFITKYGNPWATVEDKSDPVALEFSKLMKTAKVEKRPGVGFYCLRHTARTVMDQTKDFPAARMVMGHADSSIDDLYREEVGDDRLAAVAAHVRAWLFGSPGDQTGKPTLTIAEPAEADEGHNEPGERQDAEGPALRLYAG